MSSTELNAVVIADDITHHSVFRVNTFLAPSCSWTAPLTV